MRTIKLRLGGSFDERRLDSLRRVAADLFKGTVLIRDEGKRIGYFLEVPAENYRDAREYLARLDLLNPSQTG